MSKHVTVHLREADGNDYGILLQSQTVHRFTGPGIHNPSFNHLLQVWLNKPARDGSGGIVDPQGRRTEDRYSYLFSAIPSVIALRPDPNRPEEGIALALGDVVSLTIHNYCIGTFQIRARRCYDPHLIEVDTASSASRQHYIETGDYLSPGEEI